MLESRFGGGWFLAHCGTHLLVFFKGNDHTSPTAGSLHSNSYAMMFVIYMSTKIPKIMWLVQWVVWCGHLAVESRTHATANYAWAPWWAPFKLRCCRKLASRATTWWWVWKVAVTGPIPWEHAKTTHFGPQSPPSLVKTHCAAR